MTSLLNINVEKMLHLVQKNNVIANNIANVHTPNFKAAALSDFSFNTKLALNLSSTNTKHIIDRKKEQFAVFNPKVTDVKYNNNDVDLEKEITEMQRNSIEYQTAINIYNKIITMFKMSAGSK